MSESLRSPEPPPAMEKKRRNRAVTALQIGRSLAIVALAARAVEGNASTGLVVAAVFGLALLILAIVLFGLVRWKKALARRIGAALGRVVSFFRKVIRKPPVRDLVEAAVRFRH